MEKVANTFWNTNASRYIFNRTPVRLKTLEVTLVFLILFCQFEWRPARDVVSRTVGTLLLLDTNFLVPRKFTRSDVGFFDFTLSVRVASCKRRCIENGWNTYASRYKFLVPRKFTRSDI